MSIKTSVFTANRGMLKLTANFEKNIDNILEVCGNSMNAEFVSLSYIENSELVESNSWSSIYDIHYCPNLNKCVDVRNLVDPFNSKPMLNELKKSKCFCKNRTAAYSLIYAFGSPIAFFSVCFEKTNKKTSSFQEDFLFACNFIQMEIERHRGEELLKERERNYSVLFENAPDGILILNRLGIILECNNLVREMLGMELDEICGEKFSEFLRNENRTEFDLKFNSLENQDEIELEACVISEKKQLSIPVWLKARSIHSDKGRNKGCVVYIRDITELKKAEVSKMAQERLQGVLEMSGAACHELNQPLQAINGYSALLKKKTKGSPNEKWVDKIYEQVQRLGDMTKKINKISKYKVKDYIQGSQIIDIDNASDLTH